MRSTCTVRGPGDLDPGVAGGGAVMRDGQGAICCHNTAPAICKMLHVQQLCLNNQADKT